MFLTVPIMIEINMDKLVIRYRQRLTLSFLYVVINIFINEIFKMKWTEDQLRLLAQLYDKYNISWYQSNLSYTNRKKRSSVMKKLRSELKQEIPTITVDHIYQKIADYRNGLKGKSIFLRRIKDEKLRGILSEEKYNEYLEIFKSFYKLFRTEGIICPELDHLLRQDEERDNLNKENESKRKHSCEEESINKKPKLDNVISEVRQEYEANEEVKRDENENVKEDRVEDVIGEGNDEVKNDVEVEEREFEESKNPKDENKKGFQLNCRDPSNTTYEVIDISDESIDEKFSGKNILKSINKENYMIPINKIKEERSRNIEETSKEVKNIENNSVRGIRRMGDSNCDSSSLNEEPDDLWLTLMIRRYKMIKNSKTKLQLQRSIDDIIYKALDGEA